MDNFERTKLPPLTDRDFACEDKECERGVIGEGTDDEREVCLELHCTRCGERASGATHEDCPEASLTWR